MRPLEHLDTPYLLLACTGLLLLASQIVIFVLAALERRKFGAVLLGTLITPMCTGFPNLMIGLFGQERLQGDLVLQLNLGNNLANTSLVTGLLLLLAGPLSVRPKGASASARKAGLDLAIALGALWLGAGLLFWLAKDGGLTRVDALLLIAFYLLYQLVATSRRERGGKASRLSTPFLLAILAALALSAWIIQLSMAGMSTAFERAGDLLPGWHLGLFLGLLTVIPESFLMLRLAYRQGTLGLAGLVGDCLVSIPLVVGLSALTHPFKTPAVRAWTDPSALPYLILAGSMLVFTLLALRKEPAPRKLGLLFLALYAAAWWLTA